MFSVIAYLAEKHQINTKPGAKSQCPFCSHYTLSITKDDSLAKCFHPACERCITQQSMSKGINAVQTVLWEFFTMCRSELMSQQSKATTFRAGWCYLVEDRRVAPEILDDFLIGIVPTDCQIDEVIARYRNELEASVNKKGLGKKEKEYRDKALQQFNNAFSRFSGCYHTGDIAFFYTDKSGKILSIKFRKAKSKIFTSFKIGKNTGVFQPLFLKSEGLSPKSPILLAEGEFNALTLYSTLERAGENNKNIGCIALGSATGIDWNTLGGFKNQWILFRDNDEAGRKLAEAMQEYRSFKLTHAVAPDSDLDSFLRGFTDPKQALVELNTLILNASSHYRPLSSIASVIHELRVNSDENEHSRSKTKLKEFEVNKKVSLLIIEEMRGRGTFYKTDTTPYYFDNETKKLFLINREDEEMLHFLYKLGLNPAERIHTYVLNELNNRCRFYGTKTSVKDLFYYNESINTFYWSNGNQTVLKITATDIGIVDNGTDGVLFLTNPKYTPFNRVDFDVTKDYLYDLLLAPINFEDEGILSPEEQRKVLQYYFYALFFGSFMTTKPILCPVGDKGSGKSSSLRRIGQTIIGPDFDVTPLPSDVKDFQAALANNFFLAFDNVDEKSKWLNDTLAVCATGGTIRLRELYTTKKEVEIKINAFVALNSRTPNFNRDDVAERLLILKLKPLGAVKRSETEMAREIEKYRDEFLSWMVLQIQDILKALEKTSAEGLKNQFRIADFANFCFRVGTHKNEADYILGLLDKVSVTQSQFCLETDTLFECLKLYAEEHQGEWVDAGTLLKALKAIAEANGLDYYIKNTQSLGRKLQQLKPNIQMLMPFESQKRAGNKTFYSFGSSSDNDFNSNTLTPLQQSLELVGTGAYD